MQHAARDESSPVNAALRLQPKPCTGRVRVEQSRWYARREEAVQRNAAAVAAIGHEAKTQE